MGRSLTTFLVLSFVPAYCIEFALHAIRPELGKADIYQLGHMAALMCPCLAAFVARRWCEGDRAFADLRPRAPVRLYVSVLMLVMTQWLAPALIASATGQAQLLTTFSSNTPLYLLTRLIPAAVVGFGQEFGWRGYLFQRYLPRGPFYACCLAALATEFWLWGHRIPLSMQALGERTELATPLQLFGLSLSASFSSLLFSFPLTLARAAIASWLLLRTRDLWLVSVWHGYGLAFRECMDVLWLGYAESTVPGTEIPLSAIGTLLEFVVGVGLMKALVGRKP